MTAAGQLPLTAEAAQPPAEPGYVSFGRCRSGKRWFWFARTYTYESETRHCDDPVCEAGVTGHAYGWEDDEQPACDTMHAAAARLGGKPLLSDARGIGRPAQAADMLKRINTAKRSARPPGPGATGAALVEFLYEPWSWTDYDNPPYETSKGINEIPIVKKTAKRIYYDASDSWDRHDGVVTLGYIDRLEFETDTRCRDTCPVDVSDQCPQDAAAMECAAHGCTGEHCPHGDRPGQCGHGSPAGQADRPGSRWYDRGGTFFATRAAAEEHLYSWEREEERKRQEAGPELKRLRMEMAGAHPDRGGSSEEFIAARERYERAMRRAS